MKTYLPVHAKMIQEKVNNTRQAGVTDIKTVNACQKGQFHVCLQLSRRCV